MPKKSGGSMLGSWSFLIGVILALIFGLIGNLGPGVTYVLIVLGIVIGLLNIADEEVSPFLMSGAVLVIVSTLGQSVVQTVPIFYVTLQALTMLFVPATIIVALKHVFTLARH
jgi:uncharacterized membrane protein